MSLQKILVLLCVIAGIHILVIYGCMHSGKSDTPEKKAAEPDLAAVFEQLFPANAPERGEQQQSPDKFQKLFRKRTVSKVKPWVYGKSFSLPPNIQKQSKRAVSAIIVDLNTRQVLWEKNSRTPVAIASLTKLMTALLVAEKLDSDPSFNPDTEVTFSPTAAAAAYRKFNAGDKLTIRDLIMALMVGSANDAAVQLAECVNGSNAEFIRQMNLRAEKMGLTSANFNSPNGLPQGKAKINSKASAADVLHLCEAVMGYKIIMDACGENHARLSNGKEFFTTNGLLLHPRKNRSYYRKVPGLIGFKTGFTNAAGFCLAFGATRNGRTILGCVTGFPSAADRERFCSDLIEWAYSNAQVKK